MDRDRLCQRHLGRALRLGSHPRAEERDLRRHARGAWRRDEEGEWAIDLRPTADAVITLYPFRKVQKHYQLGARGDLLAYLVTACEGTAALLQAAGRTSSPRR